MYVEIYRWQLHPGQEDTFRESWRRITERASRRRGSGGSALFRDKDGSWVAIARWSSREAREQCLAGGVLAAEASALMLVVATAKLPEVELESDTDLWRPLVDERRRGRLLTRAGWRAMLDRLSWRTSRPRIASVVGLSKHMLWDVGLTHEDAGWTTFTSHHLFPDWRAARR